VPLMAMVLSVHGPVALTTTLARTSLSWPVVWHFTTAPWMRPFSSFRNDSTRAYVATTAPCCTASSAVSMVRRASSVEQS
jgi:hypothetical protein